MLCCVVYAHTGQKHVTLYDIDLPLDTIILYYILVNKTHCINY